MQLDDAEVAQQFPMFSLRPLVEIEGLLAAHAGAPHERRAQRALADELTALVHGAAAAEAAAEAADVLFGGDPVTASAGALAAIAGEVPSSRVAPGDLRDPVELLVTTQLATSKSDARRLLQQGSVRANDRRLGPEDGLDGVALLHGRYVLLRKGKRAFHLVEVSGNPG